MLDEMIRRALKKQSGIHFKIGVKKPSPKVIKHFLTAKKGFRELSSKIKETESSSNTMIIKYYVAPKEGIYDADELQDFMNNLLPYITESHKNNFKEIKESLSIGQLYFDEEVYEGKIRSIINVFPDKKLAGEAFQFEQSIKSVFDIDEVVESYITNAEGFKEYIKRIKVKRIKEKK